MSLRKALTANKLGKDTSSVIHIQHGNHIFIYNNVRTNQVVYSLTRTLNVLSPLFKLQSGYPILTD